MAKTFLKGRMVIDMAGNHLPLPPAYLPYGRLKVFFGNMFSGKTDALHQVYDRAIHGRVDVQSFKHGLDTRDSARRIKSRRGHLSVPVQTIASAESLLDQVTSRTKLVLLDEVQFFDGQILAVVHTLRCLGVDVAAAGLDLDYLARPFGPTLQLAARATEARKFTAICQRCRYDGAEYTQMVDEHTAEPITSVLAPGSPVFIEGASRYEARCGRCFVWPTEPIR